MLPGFPGSFFGRYEGSSITHWRARIAPLKMNVSELFQGYELLADRADEAFREVEKEYGPNISCERHCSDCCHAVFGLFPIEAAYLKQHFDQLKSEVKRAALLRGNEMEKGLKRLEATLKTHEGDPQMQAYAMARERIRCPLLDDSQDCILYPHRPITCRIYGVPTRIQGKGRVCGKSGFKQGESVPLFDLDGVYRDLYALSRELLKTEGKDDPEQASLLFSVSRVISAPLDEVIHETFG